MGSSRLGHRLLHIVREKRGSEVQDRLAEMLFHYQFEREADVSQVDVVGEAGGPVGLLNIPPQSIPCLFSLTLFLPLFII
jgi:predicted DsbA family dithiol-disulfide isomerase